MPRGRNHRESFVDALILVILDRQSHAMLRHDRRGAFEHLQRSCFRLANFGVFGQGWNAGALVRFHTAHKMQLLAHSRPSYEEMGRLVAEAGQTPRNALRDQYERRFMEALSVIATPARHANVLTHMAGHLKKPLDPASKHELAACIDEYRRGLVPLVVPITLIRHHVRVHRVEYLANQTYLEPHPRELMLRNHV